MVTFDIIRDKQQATTYFATELSTYYGNARIGGKLIDVLGIKNQPLDEVFNSILTNYHPVNGEKLRPNQSKRLLFSFCISAPKPFSILALYTDDTRLLNIHTKATNEAISCIERSAEVRKRKNNQNHSVKTGQTLYFACDHMLSRCNDPQIHTHVNFFNLTWDKEENGYKALDAGAMGKATIVATQIYRKTLVDEMLKIGIPAKIATNGEVVIDGITKEICTKYSKRKTQIEKIAKNYEIEISDPGWKKELRAMIANRCKNPKSTPAIERMIINRFQNEIDDIGYDEVLDKIISGKNNSAKQSSPMTLLRNTWNKILKSTKASEPTSLSGGIKIGSKANANAINIDDTKSTRKNNNTLTTKPTSKELPRQLTREEWNIKERIRKEKENQAYQEQLFYEQQEERRLKKKKEEQERTINKPKIDDDDIDKDPPCPGFYR